MLRVLGRFFWKYQRPFPVALLLAFLQNARWYIFNVPKFAERNDQLQDGRLALVDRKLPHASIIGLPAYGQQDVGVSRRRDGSFFVPDSQPPA